MKNNNDVNESAQGSSVERMVRLMDQEAIETLLRESNQTPSLELGYGSLQPIDGWEPGQEIQHDGHSRYLVMNSYKEEHKQEQNHLTPEIKQSHRNNVQEPFCRENVLESQCDDNLQNEPKNLIQQVSYHRGCNEPNAPDERLEADK